MNNQRLNNKVRLDATKVQKDISILVEDSANRIGQIGNNVGQATSQAKHDIKTWVGDSVSQFSDGFERMTGDAKDAVTNAAASVKRDVGHGLVQYNAKAQEVANRVPGNFGKKAARYPWVAITIALVMGIMLGGFLKPARQLPG